MMKRRYLTGLVLVIWATVATVALAQSGDVITEQTAQRCALAQSYLQEIQKPRDLKARVDRLQAYRYIAERLDVYTRRLEKNGQPGAAELREQVTQLNKNVDDFKNSYESYDQAREVVSKLRDCRTNVAQFQQKLEIARQKRQAVDAAVNTIQAQLDPTIKGQLSTVYTTLASGQIGDNQ